jgi:hypothetical protein
MATRSQIEFYESEAKLKVNEPDARIYHHWDGYPERRLRDIKGAVVMAEAAYASQGGFDYRIPIGKGESSFYMGDLAAFYILANKDGAGNIEIDHSIHGDLDYLYQVYPSKAGLRVRVLSPKAGFWDESTVENMKMVATGTLKTLLTKFKEIE